MTQEEMLRKYESFSELKNAVQTALWSNGATAAQWERIENLMEKTFHIGMFQLKEPLSETVWENDWVYIEKNLLLRTEKVYDEFGNFIVERKIKV